MANWKMNPETSAEAREIFLATQSASKNLKKIQVVVCPPYIYLQDLETFKEKHVKLGAQDVFSAQAGAFTGEISPRMLKREGEEYVIVGHSERRELGETDLLVSEKAVAALKAGLHVVLCVGEKARDPHGDYLMDLREQVIGSLQKVPKRLLAKLIVAYEPIWAIGKGEDSALKPVDLHETSIFIKKALTEMYGRELAMSVPILYGGAVNYKNAKELVTSGEVQGLLVGHESLNEKRFASLLESIK